MIFTLEAKKRTTTKQSERTVLRQQGMIPAVIYGKLVDSTPISIDRGIFLQFYKKSFTELAFYEIELDGVKHHTILKDKLIHPVSRNILHIDFMVIEESAEMEFEIPVQFIGEAIGLKEGGFIDVIQRMVKITCMAKNIPAEITLDISDMRVGDSRHIKDLPQGDWQYKDNADITMVVVHAKKAEAETEDKTETDAKPSPEETKPEQ